VYIIEFQKRGLPHCYILLWLEVEDKITTPSQIDQYISAEIPDKEEDPELYQIVTNHMMHGPYGPENLSYLCTVDEEMTGTLSRKMEVICITVMLYHTIQVCSGPDRVTVVVEGEEVDEVQDYYDCSIHYALDKSSVDETKFEAWMELNERDDFACPTKWDDLKEFNDVIDPTYRDACYARGLLEDGKEYINGLLEASLWGTGDYLRSFFVMLLMTDSMSRLGKNVACYGGRCVERNHLTLVKGNQYDGRTKTDPHKYIHEFLRICDMFKYKDTENEVVRLMMFPLSLTGEAKHGWMNSTKELLKRGMNFKLLSLADSFPQLFLIKSLEKSVPFLNMKKNLYRFLASYEGNALKLPWS
ncbi:hypothetical protein Tco_0914948, partial [Tanacetum coccineum]